MRPISESTTMRLPILPCLLALALPSAGAADTTRIWLDKGELHYAGYLDDDANRRLFALYASLAVKPAVLAIDSKGGDVATGLDLGQWVHDKQLDVKVATYCMSSCANYVFTAGAEKLVGAAAVIGFHGGISSTRFDLSGETKARYDAMTGVQQAQFWEQLRKDSRPLLEREARFFKMIKVRQDITTYGQAARFSDIVSDGWTYSEDGFRRFGVNRIRVLGGPWRPAPAAHNWKLPMLEVGAFTGGEGARATAP